MKIIEVLATGPSLNRWKPDGNITVGVNKIIMRYKVNHLLIVDVAGSFPMDLRKKVATEPYDQFHTFLEHEWSPFVPKDKMNVFELLHPRGSTDLDSDKMPHSVNSAFCAAALAFKLGATIIDLYGVDFIGHNTLKGDQVLKRIKTDFLALQSALVTRGVSLRVTPDGLLADCLPLIPQSRFALPLPSKYDSQPSWLPKPQDLNNSSSSYYTDGRR